VLGLQACTITPSSTFLLTLEGTSSVVSLIVLLKTTSILSKFDSYLSSRSRFIFVPVCPGSLPASTWHPLGRCPLPIEAYVFILSLFQAHLWLGRWTPDGVECLFSCHWFVITAVQCPHLSWNILLL
jgi:hypothetical protein